MRQYDALRSNVKIDLFNQNDDTKTINAVKGGTGPDIVQASVDHVGTLAAAGMIVPIDQYESSSALSSTYTKTATPRFEIVDLSGDITSADVMRSLTPLSGRRGRELHGERLEERRFASRHVTTQRIC